MAAATPRNGRLNGKFWMGLIGIVMFVFGAIIGDLRSQVRQADHYVSADSYEKDRLRDNELKDNQYREIRERLDRLLAFHTQGG